MPFNPSPQNRLGDALPERHMGEGGSPLREKHHARTFRPDQGVPECQVPLQGLDCRCPNRHHALLVALADHHQEARLEVQLLQAQVANFRQAQTTGIGCFENGVGTKRLRGGF
jgi:hypothetical protein